MELKFTSIEEIKDFMSQLKGTRGGKGSKDDDGPAATTGQAPAPLQPPAGGPAFNPAPNAAFTPPGTGPVFGQASGVDPAVQALVTRINTKIDGAIAGGQPADAVLSWFRQQCGPEAAAATMDQIKTLFLPKAAMPTLENIAKLMNA